MLAFFKTQIQDQGTLRMRDCVSKQPHSYFWGESSMPRGINL